MMPLRKITINPAGKLGSHIEPSSMAKKKLLSERRRIQITEATWGTRDFTFRSRRSNASSQSPSKSPQKKQKVNHELEDIWQDEGMDGLLEFPPQRKTKVFIKHIPGE